MRLYSSRSCLAVRRSRLQRTSDDCNDSGVTLPLFWVQALRYEKYVYVCMSDMCLKLLLSPFINVMLHGKMFSASQRCNHTKQCINNDATLYCAKNTVVSNQSCLNVIGRNKSQIRGNLLAGPGILVHDI